MINPVPPIVGINPFSSMNANNGNAMFYEARETYEDVIRAFEDLIKDGFTLAANPSLFRNEVNKHPKLRNNIDQNIKEIYEAALYHRGWEYFIGRA